MNKTTYNNPFGTWTVTTEGDCEGRTIAQLGTYTGFIDEIALALAQKCYYSLNFKVAPELPKLPAHTTAQRVSVSLGIDSETWNMSDQALASYMATVFKDRPVEIFRGTYSTSFEIVNKNLKKQEDIREAALKKLSMEEREVLGIS